MGRLDIIREVGVSIIEDSSDLEQEFLETPTEVRRMILYLVLGLMGGTVSSGNHIVALGMIFAIHEYVSYRMVEFIDEFGDIITKVLERLPIRKNLWTLGPELLVVSINILIGYPLFSFGDLSEMYAGVIMITVILVLMFYIMGKLAQYGPDLEVDDMVGVFGIDDSIEEHYSERRVWVIAILSVVISAIIYQLLLPNRSPLLVAFASLGSLVIMTIFVNLPGSRGLNTELVAGRIIGELWKALEIWMNGLLWVAIIGFPVAIIGLSLYDPEGIFGQAMPQLMRVLIAAGLVVTVVITVLPPLREWYDRLGICRS